MSTEVTGTETSLYPVSAESPFYGAQLTPAYLLTAGQSVSFGLLVDQSGLISNAPGEPGVNDPSVLQPLAVSSQRYTFNANLSFHPNQYSVFDLADNQNSAAVTYGASPGPFYYGNANGSGGETDLAGTLTVPASYPPAGLYTVFGTIPVKVDIEVLQPGDNPAYPGSYRPGEFYANWPFGLATQTPFLVRRSLTQSGSTITQNSLGQNALITFDFALNPLEGQNNDSQGLYYSTTRLSWETATPAESQAWLGTASFVNVIQAQAGFPSTTLTGTLGFFTVDSTLPVGQSYAVTVWAYTIAAISYLADLVDYAETGLPYTCGFLTPAEYPLTYTVYGGLEPPTKLVPAMSLRTDALHRPAALVPAAQVSYTEYLPGGFDGVISNDAGRTYYGNSLENSAASFPSLLVDYERNQYRIIYAVAQNQIGGAPVPPGICSFSQLTVPICGDFSEVSSAPGANTSLGITGWFPAVCPHPTDADFALMTYATGTDITNPYTLHPATLQAAFSLDRGLTWTGLGTINRPDPLGGQPVTCDLSQSGCPALSFSDTRGFAGGVACVVYGDGSSVKSRVSRDRGKTWGGEVIVSSAGAFTGLSLLGWHGAFYLLAIPVSAVLRSNTATPLLFVSRDLGSTWQASPGSLPVVDLPTGLGIIPFSGQMRLGTSHHSFDLGLTWTPN